MLFQEIAEASRAVSETRSRSTKIELLAACLSRMAPEEAEIGVGFLSGELRQGKIGLGYATIRGLATPSPAAEPSLTLSDVDAALERIAAISGARSTSLRAAALTELFGRATALEQPFLERLLLGELRQGALEGILLDAVAKAAKVSAANVRRAVMLAGDAKRVAAAALAGGEARLAEFRVQVLCPVGPMLAQTATSLTEAFDGKDELSLEHKLDGARIQVHKDGSDVRVFTRSLNDVTDRVPEIVEMALALPARQLILDGEAIALGKDGRPAPFQTTMRRFGRKLDVHALRGELPLHPFFFDLLYADAGELLDHPEGERFRELERLTAPSQRVERLVARSPEEAEKFLARALELGHEGVMAKAVSSPYEAGRRGASWLKIKKAHTLDLVVLAAEWGSGRRKGFLSNLHLGARDPKSAGFVMLGKTFKGLTDELLRWQTAKLQTLELTRSDWVVYVRPELVVEIAFDGVQTSSQYPGGMALRFARVKRYREDKPAFEADTIDTVRAIHARSFAD
ncbi:MAG TPA: ATP-dependent DNA ligase [Polyangiaceae bacterium]|jgi:DNA ligase-1|nr:ATP-dependent DNA ligase [Polyangiaceae bacterium]